MDGTQDLVEIEACALPVEIEASALPVEIEACALPVDVLRASVGGRVRWRVDAVRWVWKMGLENVQKTGQLVPHGGVYRRPKCFDIAIKMVAGKRFPARA